MSEMEGVHGVFKRVHTGDLTLTKLEELCAEYNVSFEDSTEEDEVVTWVYSRSREVAYLDHRKELYIMVEDESRDPEDGYNIVTPLTEDTYRVETYYYNGGACFTEMLSEGLPILEEGENNG